MILILAKSKHSAADASKIHNHDPDTLIQYRLDVDWGKVGKRR